MSANKLFRNPVVIIVAGLAVAAMGVVASTGGVQKVASSLGQSSPLGRLVSTTQQSSTVPTVTGPGMSMLRELDSTFAKLSETASHGVVAIRTGSNGYGGGQGSGFIFRSDGWIVTNDHVTSGLDKVTVVLNDGREFEGKVTRANDNQMDLAVIKIEATGLPTLKVADSSKVQPGQFAVALGAPFGLQNTVTIGHVSALDRGSEVNDPTFGPRGYTGLIQTDAPINPGNSGGPLLNIDGEIIGVNSTIVSTTNASAGIGFSIPSNVVAAVADEMISTGKFDRGMIGAEIREVLPYEREKYKVAGGAFIEMIQPEGPTAKAGLQKGDIITAIDGKKLLTQLDLRIALYKGSPGKNTQVEYVRGGKVSLADVKLSAPQTVVSQNRQMNQNPFQFDPFSGRQSPQDPRERSTPMLGPVRLGVVVRLADDTVRNQFKLGADVKGVVIVSVTKGSFAESVGLKAGDVLTMLNGEEVKDVNDIPKTLEEVQWGDPVTVEANRYEGAAVSKITVTEPIR